MIVSFKTREGELITDTSYIVGIVQDATYGPYVQVLLSSGVWIKVSEELAEVRKKAQFATDGRLGYEE